MNSSMTSGAYSDCSEAVQNLKQMFDFKAPNQKITVISSYRGNIFSFEFSYKMDSRIQELIKEKLQTRTQESMNWILANSKPTVPYARLTAIKMETEEFDVLQKKISECGIVINEVIPPCEMPSNI